MAPTRTETDSLGPVEIPSDRLWGAQTQRAIEHFNIGEERMPREILAAYAILKRAAAIANHVGGRLSEKTARSIVAACDEILEGRHDDMFPLHVWMSGSGTQFNMNVNEVIANRVSQMAGQPLGSKKPAHPNDHVNMSQSTNDTFPTAMHIGAALSVANSLTPALIALRDALAAKAAEWMDIVKIGRTHLQDATPLTLGQEFSGYAAMLTEGLARLDAALQETFRLALGGTAVGTGINAPPDFAPAAIAEIARATALPFVAATNRFAAQGAHDALVHLSGVLRGIAVSLYKIANDIRLMACGPRAGLAELRLPENEPGSSIMPGKVNPTQAEAMTMAAAQVMANDVAVGFAGAGGYLEMNVYKPLIAHNVLQSIRLLASASQNFRKHMIEGAEPDRGRIGAYVERSLMLATALAPRIGYDQAARAAHYAADHDLSVKEAALALRLAPEDELDRLLDPAGMVRPHTGSHPMKEPKAPEKGQPKPDELDEALEETFPASDPLPASPGATGAEPPPPRNDEDSGKKKG